MELTIHSAIRLKICSVGGCQVSTTETGLLANQRYFFRVRAQYSDGTYSAPSIVNYNTTVPGPVTNVRVLSDEHNKIVVDWRDTVGKMDTLSNDPPPEQVVGPHYLHLAAITQRTKM